MRLDQVNIQIKRDATMYIMPIKILSRILNNLDSGVADPHQVDLQFAMHRNSMQFYLNNRNAVASEKNYQDAADRMSESTGVQVSPAQAKDILSLFPAARIKLAVHDGCSDSDVRDLISEAAWAYFAGSESPTFDTKTEADRMYRHLQAQAVEMGFALKE